MNIFELENNFEIEFGKKYKELNDHVTNFYLIIKVRGPNNEAIYEKTAQIVPLYKELYKFVIDREILNRTVLYKLYEIAKEIDKSIHDYVNHTDSDELRGILGKIQKLTKSIEIEYIQKITKKVDMLYKEVNKFDKKYSGNVSVNNTERERETEYNTIKNNYDEMIYLYSLFGQRNIVPLAHENDIYIVITIFQAEYILALTKYMNEVFTNSQLPEELKIKEDILINELSGLKGYKQRVGVKKGGGKKSKKQPKKEVNGVSRCIYKIPGDRKEYVRSKGKLITLKDLKKNMKPKKRTKT